MNAALDWLNSTPAAGLPVTTVALDLLLAFLLAQFVAWLYTHTHRGLSYSRNLVHSLVLLSMIVAMVMLVVGDSISRAFGLVGALAIIRFRTVVRDARDTTFIFLCLAIGIAVGSHHYAVALAGTLLVGSTAALLQWSNFGTRNADTGMLRVRGQGDLALALMPILAGACSTHDLVALREGGPGGESEWSYRIRLRDPGQQERLIEEVRRVEGAKAASVVLEEGAEEW